MKKQSVSHAPAIGSCSLLVIFGVLCLAILALLALRAAITENQLAETSAQSVTAWYQADLEAQRIYAALRAGETIPEVTVEKEVYRYNIPVTQHQTLDVVLKKENGSWFILRWQTTAHPEEINQTLPVWQGSE